MVRASRPSPSTSCQPLPPLLANFQSGGDVSLSAEHGATIWIAPRAQGRRWIAGGPVLFNTPRKLIFRGTPRNDISALYNRKIGRRQVWFMSYFCTQLWNCRATAAVRRERSIVWVLIYEWICLIFRDIHSCNVFDKSTKVTAPWRIPASVEFSNLLYRRKACYYVVLALLSGFARNLDYDFIKEIFLGENG